MEDNTELINLFTLTLTKNNHLDFLESELVIRIRAGEPDYFIQQLTKFCSIIPEFTYQPIFYHWNNLWRYDSDHFWDDDIGRCSFRFRNAYFGFDGERVNKFESIYIDWESFEIKQLGRKKVKRLCGVPVDYLSAAQRKAVEEQEEELERIRKENESKREQDEKTNKLKKERAKLINKLSKLERGKK